MPCDKCEELTAAYKMASERYEEATASVLKLAVGVRFKSREYRKLIAEEKQARDACYMANAALRVHRESH